MGYAKQLYTEHYYKNLVLGAKDWAAGTVRKEHKDILDKLELKDCVIIDLGCGRGDVLRYCLEHEALHVYGYDFSPDAIKLSQETVKDFESYTLVEGDILETLPKHIGDVDYVFMFDSIEHIPSNEIDAILREVRRITKKLIVLTPFYKVHDDCINQGYFKRASPTDKNPLTSGMHCCKYTKISLLDKLAEHGFWSQDGIHYERIDGTPVVAFYTVDTPYEEEVCHLRDSLVSHKMRYHLKGVPNRSKWEFNCGIKPEFLREMLDLYDKVLYVDADAIIRGPLPFVEQFNETISVHYKDKELLSGTIILTKQAIPIVDAWIKNQRANPNEWDQRVLDKTLKELGIVPTPLPPEYVKIFDSMKGVKPLIEHYQASRRFKNRLFIGGHTHIEIPNTFNVTVRFNPDGSFWIPRSNRKLEEWLDKHYVRMKGEKKWWPVVPTNKFIDDYQMKYKGMSCYLVGKGPSLDYLDESYFDGKSPVIAINESFNTVQKLNITNPIFGTQQDTWMGPCCKPTKGKLITSPRAYNLYKDINNFTNVYMINPSIFGLSPTPSSFSYAMKIGQLLGCNSLIMLCFDACVNGQTDYAKTVGYDPSNMGDPKRFLSHRRGIELAANGLPLTWIIPIPVVSLTDQNCKQSIISDIPEQQPNNLEEHHEHGHAECSTCSQDKKDLPSGTGRILIQNLICHLEIGQQS